MQFLVSARGKPMLIYRLFDEPLPVKDDKVNIIAQPKVEPTEIDYDDVLMAFISVAPQKPIIVEDDEEIKPNANQNLETGSQVGLAPICAKTRPVTTSSVEASESKPTIRIAPLAPSIGWSPIQERPTKNAETNTDLSTKTRTIGKSQCTDCRPSNPGGGAHIDSLAPSIKWSPIQERPTKDAETNTDLSTKTRTIGKSQCTDCRPSNPGEGTHIDPFAPSIGCSPIQVRPTKDAETNTDLSTKTRTIGKSQCTDCRPSNPGEGTHIDSLAPSIGWSPIQVRPTKDAETNTDLSTKTRTIGKSQCTDCRPSNPGEGTHIDSLAPSIGWSPIQVKPEKDDETITDLLFKPGTIGKSQCTDKTLFNAPIPPLKYFRKVKVGSHVTGNTGGFTAVKNSATFGAAATKPEHVLPTSDPRATDQNMAVYSTASSNTDSAMTDAAFNKTANNGETAIARTIPGSSTSSTPSRTTKKHCAKARIIIDSANAFIGSTDAFASSSATTSSALNSSVFAVKSTGGTSNSATPRLINPTGAIASSSATTSSASNGPMVFTTPRGKRQLYYNGFKYSCRNRYEGKSDVRWYCSSHHSKGCRASVRTIDYKIVSLSEIHNHEPTLQWVEKN
ncbi:hypothetical protein PYW07_016458 [Mythimna separata]|uniref:FLYWCH-type domain-containing protein n=1 Tax=Mythimna separata TaxID=271217 RepID=A0AAD7YKI4_MYTSE|nr:hypothetical protein PYW07_016458 [Mythimna separata]